MTASSARERRTWGTGRVYKRKRSSCWYIRWYDINGKRRTKATKTTNKAEAERMLRAELDAKDRGVNPDADRLMFKDLERILIDDRVVRGRRSPLKLLHLRAHFGETRAVAITGMAVRRYERERLDAGAARATVNNELAALRRMFNLAVEHRLLTRDQIPRIRTPDPHNARTGFFEPDEIELVLAQLPEYLRPVMTLGYLTGWRVRSEVLPLRWQQVDFANGTIRLDPNTTKNNEGRTFPFSGHPKLKALLEAQRALTDEVQLRRVCIIPWVFHRDGEPIHDYKRAWESACRRAAIEVRDGQEVIVRPQLIGRLVHDLRRTAVRNLERAGVSRSAAMKLTGHKTESIYRRYAIVAESDLREGVAKLAMFAGAHPGG